ncbi:MAG: ATPase, T2SS/T4P/T4SS family [Candidatus Aenigmatarchaeota archaeon]
MPKKRVKLSKARPRKSLIKHRGLALKRPKVRKKHKKIIKVKKPIKKEKLIKEVIQEKPIQKQLIVTFPEKEGVGVKYSLIEPFVYVDIIYDEKEKEYIYNVIEPKLSEDEQKIYEKIVSGLMEIIDIELSAVKRKEEALSYLEEQTKKVLDEYEIKLSKEAFLKILYYVQRNFVGLNEIEPLMQDPYIEDISCDGIGIPIYIIHRRYGSIKTNIVFSDAKKLKEFVVKLAERSGRFISYAEPLLDGTLPDGSRVQATFASDVTTRGPSFTIRKFVQEPLSPIDLLNKKTVNSEILAYLWLAVENGASILIAGGVGTGKTTLLNALLMFVPSEAKIISIEDTRELNLPHENWVPAVTRVGFAKGYGEVNMFDLLKEAFRQTPSYVIVGEVRGAEAYVMFQGMAAGIPAMGTMHAGRVDDVIYRLQTPPINLSPTLIDTLDIVIIMIHTREKGESARRMKEIVEIESVDPVTGKTRTNQVFSWFPSEDNFEYHGTSYQLQEIAAHKGVEVSDLFKELERRKALLEWMQKNNIINYKDVVRILTEYRKNPKKVLKEAKISV